MSIYDEYFYNFTFSTLAWISQTFAKPSSLKRRMVVASKGSHVSNISSKTFSFEPKEVLWIFMKETKLKYITFRKPISKTYKSNSNLSYTSIAISTKWVAVFMFSFLRCRSRSPTMLSCTTGFDIISVMSWIIFLSFSFEVRDLSL